MEPELRQRSVNISTELKSPKLKTVMKSLCAMPMLFATLFAGLYILIWFNFIQYSLSMKSLLIMTYFRALQFPPEAWLRMSLHNSSLTWIAIRPSGRVVLRALGDCGHIPPDKLTTT